MKENRRLMCEAALVLVLVMIAYGQMLLSGVKLLFG